MFISSFDVFCWKLNCSRRDKGLAGISHDTTRLKLIYSFNRDILLSISVGLTNQALCGCPTPTANLTQKNSFPFFDMVGIFTIRRNLDHSQYPLISPISSSASSSMNQNYRPKSQLSNSSSVLNWIMEVQGPRVTSSISVMCSEKTVLNCWMYLRRSRTRVCTLCLQDLGNFTHPNIYNVWKCL